jgi:3-hydroxybutyryl-CoA dehydrogenase
VTIDRAGVVGAGLMGAGIAEVCARAGLDVVVVDSAPSALRAGQERMTASLHRAVRGGHLTEDERAAAWDRVSWTGDYLELADREIVIEAIVEAAEEKIAVFEKLDKIITSPTAILASNTSSIPITHLAVATRRPDYVVGLHFFNPAPVLHLVELVSSLVTSEETSTRAEQFATGQLNKRVVRCPDRAGFVVNALLIPYLLSAIRMYESGFATAADIDTAMVEGCAHPMGPLHLADLIGLDTTMAVAEKLYAEFKEPLYAPPSLLLRMVAAGLLGRKSGRGFFEYPAAP